MNDSEAATPDFIHDLRETASRVSEASRSLAHQPSRHKDAALEAVADALRNRTDRILEANERDMSRAREAGDYDVAFLDRLRLDADRIEKMALDVEEVAELEDPVGRIDEQWVRPNGLEVGRKRIPLGTIGFIYESRPNVTSDAANLCLKSGNGILLKGGSAAFESNRAIYRAIRRGLDASPLPDEAEAAIGFVDSTDRRVVGEMLGLADDLDVVIPRGGRGLIEFVTEESRIPVIKHDEGVCHVVVDGSADAEMVDDIVLNAKTQRPSVCNAAETLLFLENAIDAHLPRVLERLADAGVRLHLCDRSLEAARERDIEASAIESADEEAYRREYLSEAIAIRVVESLDEACDHVATYGSHHTEAIVTENYSQSRTFVDRVDSSVVLVNASTRFSDGNQLGLGAEIGISTTRMHAYGPMGVEALTTTKFVVFGDGQIRE
jgi:glutamate-5-semialdehyde dehydrogenase